MTANPPLPTQIEPEDAPTDATTVPRGVAPPFDGAGDDFDDPTSVDEISGIVAWQAGEHFNDAAALIVDEHGERSGAMNLMVGADHDDESTALVVLVGAQRTQGKLNAGAIPTRVARGMAGGISPYARFVYSLIDGVRTVGEIQRAGLLADAEVTASLLLLLDHGCITISPGKGRTETSTGPGSGHLPPLPLPTPLPVLDSEYLVELTPPTAQFSGKPSPLAVPFGAAAEPPALQTPNTSPTGPLGQLPVDPKRAMEHVNLALADERAGHLVSARMNAKLAIAYEPQNLQNRRVFMRLAGLPCAPKPRAPTKKGVSGLLLQANQAEQNGEIDLAIRCLKLALREGESPAVLNRLGIALAVKKRRFRQARRAIERAVELAPDNPTYERNLMRVLAMAAAEPEPEVSVVTGFHPPKALAGGWIRRIVGWFKPTPRPPSP